MILKTPSPQQRNVVLHPEFVNGNMHFIQGRRMDLLKQARRRYWFWIKRFN